MKQLKNNTIEELQQSKFILIRHAQSTYNLAWETNVETILKDDEDREDAEHECATDQSLIDATLSEHGISQCD